jgi:hypothetical protein
MGRTRRNKIERLDYKGVSSLVGLQSFVGRGFRLPDGTDYISRLDKDLRQRLLVQIGYFNGINRIKEGYISQYQIVQSPVPS